MKGCTDTDASRNQLCHTPPNVDYSFLSSATVEEATP